MTHQAFPPPAGTALFLLGDVAAEDWRDQAEAADWLVITLHEVSADATAGASPWHGTAAPGASGGCRVEPHASARRFDVFGDPAGIYLISTVDLLLRTHGVRHIVVHGTPEAAFARNLESFAALQGYTLSWQDDGAALPEALAQTEALLPDLAARVSPQHAALVLIDVQNDFCAAEGATGRGGAPITMITAAVERIKRLLAAARQAGLLVVHVRAEYGAPFRAMNSPYRFPTEGGREPAVWTASAAELDRGARFGSNSVEVCQTGTWGAAFVDGIEPRADECVIVKHRFGAFADTGLDRLLRARGISSVIVAGVTTNCCVETTAREAVMRHFYLVVAEDCVAVKDHLIDLHTATLESLSLYFGLVRPSEAIIAAWQGDAAPLS